jgi:general nucleoside transport system permease protein
MGDLVGAVLDVLSSPTAYGNALAVAVFLAFGASGEWVAERSGTLNISIEGMYLAGAFGATMGFHLTNSLAAGLVLGVVASFLVAMVQAQMSHRLTADQFVVGLTLNVLLIGVTGFLNSELEPSISRAGSVRIPLLADIPLVGAALFDRSWLFYLIYPLVPICWWLVYRTRWGLEVQAVGENPQSADVSGIDVNARRRQAIYVVGITAGMGGTYLVLGSIGQFSEGMIGGRGFIALAAVIFGGWTLRGSIAGTLLFGAVLSFRLSLSALGYVLNGDILAATPFLVTLLVMLIFAKRVRAPAALARPFVRGLR